MTNPPEYQKQYRNTHRKKFMEYQRNFHIKHPHKRKTYMRTHKYGISDEQFQQMLIQQDYKCSICENAITGGRDTNIDHNHTTGQVRALLCNKCNPGIGFFDENPSLMLKAIAYLEKWRNN